MKLATRCILLAALMMLVGVIVACGGAEESAAAPAMQGPPGLPGLPGFRGNPGNPGNPGPAAAAPQAPAARAMSAPAAPAAPAPAPTAAPVAASEKVVVKEFEVEGHSISDEGSEAGEFSEERAALVAQNRIIVRTVQLALEVDDVADSIEVISQSVQRDGGWVVSTDRGSKHYGFIAVRVPAAKLDDALKWMRGVGVGCAVGGFHEHGCYGRIL